MKRHWFCRIFKNSLPTGGHLGRLLCSGLISLTVAISSPAATVGTPAWSSQVSGTDVQLRAVHFIDSSRGWAAGAEATLLQTINGGHTWRLVDSHGIDPAFGFDSVRAIDASTIWAGGVLSLTRSTDAGSTWSSYSLTSGPLRNCLFPVDAETAWAVGQGTEGGNSVHYHFRYTIEAGETLQESLWSTPATGSLNAIQMLDHDTGWSVGALGAIYKITDGNGPSPVFSVQPSGVQTSLNAIHMRDAQTGWAAGNSGTIIKTTDGGLTWSPLTSGTAFDLRAIFFVSAQDGWAVGSNGAIIHSTDGGASWASEASGYGGSLLGVHGTGPVYAVGSSGTVLKRASDRWHFFPRFLYEPGAWTEGYGFVNPGAAPAKLQFWAYGEAGQLLSASGPVVWPARAQAAYQADGLLGVTSPTTGWVLAQSDQPEPLGYFLTQRFSGGLAGLDGAEAVTGLVSEGVFPRARTTGTFTSELFLANPGPTPVQVTLTGCDGAVRLGGGTHFIPSMGFVKADAATIFPALFDGFIHVEATGGVVGNLLLRDGDRSISSLGLQAVPFEPPAQDYDDFWSGISSQVRPVSFLVANDAVVTVNVEVEVSACNAILKDSHTFNPPVPLDGGSFTVTVSTARYSYTLTGTFTSPTRASGIIQFNYVSINPPCTSSGQVTWSASRSKAAPDPADTAAAEAPPAATPGPVPSLSLAAPRAAKILYAPHIVWMPDIYYTEVCLINPGNTVALATLSPFRADGAPLVAPFQVSIPAGQCLVLRDAELGLPDGQNTDGWLKVECEDQELTGCLTFGNPVDNHYMSTLPLLSAAAYNQYFAQVVSGDAGGVSFFTGLAIINPATVISDVNITVYFSDGTINGMTSKRLAPGEKYVRLLKTIEDFQNLADQSSGYLEVRSTQPAFAFLLFGNDSLDFLSAVPAQF